MRLTPKTLFRKVFLRAVFGGALVLLVVVPLRVSENQARLNEMSRKALRIADPEACAEALSKVVVEMGGASSFPTVAFVIVVSLLLFTSFFVARPTSDCMLMFRDAVHDTRNRFIGFLRNINMVEKNLKSPAEAIVDMKMNAESLLRLFDADTRRFSSSIGVNDDPVVRVDLCGIVCEAATEFEEEARVKGLELICDIPDDSVFVKCRKGDLAEILENLTGNAIKYTKEGSVTLAVRKGKWGLVGLSVSDTGIGMSKSFQKTMYDRFTRERRGEPQHGDGLGLGIVKDSVAECRGLLRCRSVEGKGTRFTVVLPANRFWRTVFFCRHLPNFVF